MQDNKLQKIDSIKLDSNERKILKYWTKSRKAKAIPIKFPKPKGRPPKFDGFPDISMKKPFMVEHPRDIEDLTRIYPLACYNTKKVSNMNVSPYVFSGKLFMTIKGKNYVGSAWCIYKSSIFTAGHCLNDGKGNWATSVLFEGRYSNGSSAGSWAINRLVSLKGWTNSRNFQYDLAAGIATSSISPTMGTMGWVANGPVNLGPYDAIGYPAKPITGYNFNGKYMWHSKGPYVSGTAIIKACNNMTGGCSGGPWEIKYNGKGGYANGLNSHRYSDGDYMYSPYFGTGFLNIVSWLKSNGGA